MDQNQTVDNDLQKAIDDITNNTNTDPVFSDPVAAPSSVPEGDTGELAEPTGPFPEPVPEPKVEMIAPAPEPIAPLDPINIPDLPMPETTAPAAPAEPPMPPAPTQTPTQAPAPAAEAPLAPAPAPVTEQPITESAPQALSMGQVKTAALRDLIPLLDHLNLPPVQKFSLYRDIFEELRDYTILEPAYHAAREIPDEHERAEALLYLVESIDKM